MVSIVNDNELSFSHFNVRSLYPSVDLLSNVINDEQIDVVGLSETWLSSSIADNDLKISGYQLFREDWRGGRGGGVTFYIKDYIKVKQLDLPQGNGSLESMWLQIKVKGKNW